MDTAFLSMLIQLKSQRVLSAKDPELLSRSNARKGLAVAFDSDSI